MKHVSPSYIALSLAAVALCASAAVPSVVYLRTQSSLAFVSQVEADMGQQSIKERQSRQAKQEIIATEKDRAALATLSINKDDAAGFISQLESIARAQHVVITIGSVDITGEGTLPLQTLSLQANVEGSQLAVISFLQQIESLPTASSVPAFSLEKREKSWVLVVSLRAAIKT